MKEAFLKALLRNVCVGGWGEASFLQACQDLSLSPAWAWALFPGGATDAIGVWSHHLDHQTIESLGQLPLGEMKVRVRIFEAVKTRLMLQATLRDAVAHTLEFLAHPQHSWLSLRLLVHTADALWRGVGDTSLDYNYYTKRGLLTGVYGATLIFWSQDQSNGWEASWDFLEKRLEDVLKIQKIKGRVTEGVREMVSPQLNQNAQNQNAQGQNAQGQNAQSFVQNAATVLRFMKAVGQSGRSYVKQTFF